MSHVPVRIVLRVVPVEVSLRMAPRVSVGVVSSGAAGPAGVSGGSFHHVQSVVSSTWVIDHNLGYRPGGIVVFDTAGDLMFGPHLTYPTLNRVVLGWNVPFNGSVYLS